MKDAVAMFASTLFVDARMFEVGRFPLNTQSVSLYPFVVLGFCIKMSVPPEFPEKMHDVREGA
jgi:hypothetical protein